jgi:transmembrane sensor
MKNPSKISPHLLEQAIAWHTRLCSGEETESDWGEFTLWLEASPEHRQAYEEVEEFSSSLKGTSFSFVSDERSMLRLNKDGGPMARFQSLWVASAVAVAAVLILFVTFPRQRPEFRSAEYSTHTGEMRTVRLADGSVADLNTATRLRVAMGDAKRRVILVQGEVLFHVVKDLTRPFEVSLGPQTASVVGTVFDVLRTNKELSITVAEGRVRFSNMNGHQNLLAAGDQLVYRHEFASQIGRVNPSAIGAWRKGYLVYEDATLAEIVEDLNRYFPHQIRVADPPAARQRFSGVLRIDQEKAVLTRLSHLLPIAPDYSRRDVVVLHSSAKKD